MNSQDLKHLQELEERGIKILFNDYVLAVIRTVCVVTVLVIQIAMLFHMLGVF